MDGLDSVTAPAKYVDQVLELDGPPMAYIELAAKDDDGREYQVRLYYRTIACVGDSEESVMGWLNEQLEKIRAACRDVDGFILYRKRPEAEKRPGRGKRWIARARLITSRPIDATVWDGCICPEGATPRTVP